MHVKTSHQALVYRVCAVPTSSRGGNGLLRMKNIYGVHDRSSYQSSTPHNPHYDDLIGGLFPVVEWLKMEEKSMSQGGIARAYQEQEGAGFRNAGGKSFGIGPAAELCFSFSCALLLSLYLGLICLE